MMTEPNRSSIARTILRDLEVTVEWQVPGVVSLDLCKSG